MDNLYITMEDIPTDFKGVAEIIGMEAALKLVKARGGEGIYIPKLQSLTREARNRAIVKEFDNSNHRDLARRYQLTPRTVRRIISCAGAGKRNDGGTDAGCAQL